MISNEERMRILEQVEKGEISPDEAANRLQASGSLDLDTPMQVLDALEKGVISSEEAMTQLGRQAESEPLIIQDVTDQWEHDPATHRDNAPRGIWGPALWSGIAFTVIGAGWMAGRLQNAGLDLWFYCAWLPLALGIALIALAWGARNSPWLKLRIRAVDGDGEHSYNLRFPIPLGIGRWGVRVFRNRIPESDVVNLTGLMDALRQGVRPNEPIVIRVDDDEEGEHVELVLA